MNNTIRIDKYLAQLGIVSRRDARKFFRAGKVMINEYVEENHGFHVTDGDKIAVETDHGYLEFVLQQNVSLLLHKPAGYVCSEVDEGGHLSYNHLLDDCVYMPLVKVAGRLDQDTTGLVLATSDGALIHRIISPKSKKEKEYQVTCAKEISDDALARLAMGVTIQTRSGPYLTLPAETVRKDAFSFVLKIIEGKFHQVKLMCQAVDNECVALHRTAIGEYRLDDLAEGKWKML